VYVLTGCSQLIMSLDFACYLHDLFFASKMEEICSTETSDYLRTNTCHHTEERTTHMHCQENPKSNTYHSSLNGNFWQLSDSVRFNIDAFEKCDYNI
jgi:hypothetical protein